MAPTFGVLLSEGNVGRQRTPVPEADLVLLERTLFDPPRAGAAARWAEQVRRLFPNAEPIPYVWHLVSHGPEDGLREHASRSMAGPPQAFGQLQTNPEVEQAWDAVAQTFGALDAKRVVLRTPASVSPGPVGRGRIEAFVTSRREQGFEVIWEPEGLWEPDQAAAFARSLGVPLIWRAFTGGRPVRSEEDDSILVGPDTWLRAEGMGRRPKLSADQIDALLEHLEAAPNAVIVFSGPKAIANLQTLRGELGQS